MAEEAQIIDPDDQGEVFYVENDTIDHKGLFTFEKACEIANKDSIEFSVQMNVRHRYEYPARRIYWCGHMYEEVLT